jgi:hypothetical protein
LAPAHLHPGVVPCPQAVPLHHRAPGWASAPPHFSLVVVVLYRLGQMFQCFWVQLAPLKFS